MWRRCCLHGVAEVWVGQLFMTVDEIIVVILFCLLPSNTLL